MRIKTINMLSELKLDHPNLLYRSSRDCDFTQLNKHIRLFESTSF